MSNNKFFNKTNNSNRFTTNSITTNSTTTSTHTPTHTTNYKSGNPGSKSGNPGSKSDYSGSRTGNPVIKSGYKSDKTQELTIRGEIDEWIKETRVDNFDEQIVIYESNKSTWNIQTKYILKELTRNHKNELLSYVLGDVKLSSSKSSDKDKYKSYTLLNENVWVGKNNIVSENDFDLIIETFDILISNGYDFFEFSVLSNETINKTEITNMLTNPYQFYVNVMRKDSRFPSSLQDELFKYLSVRMGLKNPESFVNSLQKNTNIIDTINSMISNYYTDQKVLERRLKSTESFLGALINSDNRINVELRDRLYNYFTKIYWNKEHFVRCLLFMINKITDTNSMLIIDNMQFILSRNVDIMTHEIFKLIVLRESTRVTERNVIGGLLTNLVGRKDLTNYFETIDMGEIKSQFISTIIDNHSYWIDDIIEHQKLINPDVSIDEFKLNDYGCLMMILGIAYSNGYLRERILSIVSSIIELTDVNLIKPFGIFLETSKIKSNELEQAEHELISKYIHKFYLCSQSAKREKFIVETILSTFAFDDQTHTIRTDEIEQFLRIGSFVILKSKAKKSNPTSKINFNNKFNGMYESDDEFVDESNDDGHDKNSDDKTNESFGADFDEEIFDEEEFDEPNEHILKIINIYFKSLDLEASFDDLKYFIETSKVDINYKDFAYALFYSFSERTLRDIEQIKGLIHQMSLIIGFERIHEEICELSIKNTNLIEMLKSDNPKLPEIISNLI
jgi:hypothetical protein